MTPCFRSTATPTRPPIALVGTDNEYMRFLAERRRRIEQEPRK